MSKIVVFNRPATDNDIDAIMSIVNRAYLLVKGDSGLAYATAWTDRYRNRSQCQKDVAYTIVGTLEDGSIVCSGKGQVNLSSDSVDIGPLAVDPDYQGKGFGRQLLDILESLASKQVLWVVSCRTDILELYHRRRYVITKTVPVTDMIPLDRLTRPDLKMHKMERIDKMIFQI